MTGDPKVLAPLQRAYLAATNAKVLQRIQIVWDFETSGKIVNNDADADAEIRAWTPPPAEPSLEQRVAELEAKAERHLLYLRDCIDSTEDRLAQRISSLEQHPEPTAPDDPVCAREGCGHPANHHHGLDGACWHMTKGDDCTCHAFIPAPQPAPDLDPVRVEAATKALFHTYNPSYGWDDHREWHFKWRQQAEATIRAYLKDGGA